MTDTVFHEVHASYGVLEKMYLAVNAIGQPIKTADIELYKVLQTHHLPAVILRSENEDIDFRDQYTGGNETQSQPNFMGSGIFFEHDQTGKLQVTKSAVDDDPSCRDVYIVNQFYSIEIMAEHKTGAHVIVNELWFKVQRAIARLSIPGLLYDGSFSLRPGRDEAATEHHARILRYVHRTRYDAALTNTYNEP